MKYKRNIYLLCGIIFLQGFVFYGPIATLYRESRGISMFEIFMIESVSWLVMIALEIPFGWFADRFGYKRTLILANGVFFLSKIIFFKAHSFDTFLLERILLAFALAGLSGCDVALLHDSTEEPERDRVYSRYSACSTAGFLIASLLTTGLIQSPLGAADLDRVGLYTIFPYGLAFVWTCFLTDVPKKMDKRPRLRESVKKALNQPALIALVIAVALSREVFQAVTVFLNQGLYLRSGINVRWFGLLIVIIQGICLSATKAHYLGRLFGHRRALLGLLILMPMACGMLFFVIHPMASFLGILIISISMAFMEPLSTFVKNRALEDVDRATVLSVYAMGSELIAAAVNPLIGKAAGESLGSALMVCIGVGMIGTISYYLFGKKTEGVSARRQVG